MSKTLDDYLNEVDYKFLNSSKYIPTTFALKFMNFIKLVNGTQGESNKTPPAHLVMLDKLANRTRNKLVNLCSRGAAKTTLFGEYMILYIACFGELPHLPNIHAAMYVSDSMENGVKSLRKNLEFRYQNSEFLQSLLPKDKVKFTDTYIEFTNVSGHKFGIRMFGATSGIRGTKIFGKRPSLCIIDDLINEEAAKSKTVMDLIKDTVYKGVDYALDPTNSLTVMCGTPFNSEDIMIEAVESGAWEANVYPICERFPCDKEEFSGSWEDRFTYDYVYSQYDLAAKTGKLNAFYQELMLRISTDEERIIQEVDIRYISRKDLLANINLYNVYITTDFATSEKESADYSVVGVWAYSSNGDWILIDGYCLRQTMDKNIDRLFKYVVEYSPLSVGIETAATQKAFIQWIQREMTQRNIWFNFASSGSELGIRPVKDKYTRFNYVVPMFKAGKIYFAEELRNSSFLRECLGEIALVTFSGIKGKDDCLDMISQLQYLNPWKPSSGSIPERLVKHPSIPDTYIVSTEPEESESMASYVV